MKGNFITYLLLGLILLISLQASQYDCLVGYPILTRKKISDSQNEGQKYIFEHRCLCPNDYFGNQCQTHINILCYLSDNYQSYQKQTNINQNNIKQQLNLEMDFLLNCWVGSKDVLQQKLNLNHYLSIYNQSNAFGVREQFGADVDIVWANTTQNIFNQDGQFKIISQMRANNQSYQLSEQQKLKLLIGNNKQLYDNPFTYQSYFLGYGLINGDVNYYLRIFHPEKGMKVFKNYTNQQISWLQHKGNPQNSRRLLSQQSQHQSNQQTQTPKKSFKENSVTIPNPNNKQLQQRLNNLRNRYQDVYDSNDLMSNEPYQIKIPIQINPYKWTSYSAIRFSLIIQQNYQEFLMHQISLNSYDWTLPVNLPNVGYQPTLHKNISVASQSYKTYYKIVLVVGITLFVYFSLSIGYKKWKAYRQKKLQQQEYQLTLEQQVLKINK